MDLIRIFSKVINKTKGEGSEYNIDKAISNKQLIRIVYYRFFEVIRGQLVKIGMKSSGLVFAGKRVRLKFKNQIKAGKNLILGDNVLIDALSTNGVNIGNNVTIAYDSKIVCTGVIRNLGVGLTIKDESAIGASSFISCQGGIEIGNQVIMGPGVMIFSENHNFSDLNLPIKYQGESRAKVTIGDDCWVGAGSIILAGVSLGSQVVVAAGSVVTKSFESRVVIGGIPAKVIRSI